jgi:thiamine pyrophosphate-dependent acetolactate synthase large subunit-like protein
VGSRRPIRCLFTIGLGQRDWPAVAVEEADCVIAVGFDMVEYHPKLWNKGNVKAIVHVDHCIAEVDDNYRVAAEVVGDIAEALDALAAATKGMARPDPALYAKYREAMLGDFHRYEADDAFPVKPQRVLSDVRKAMDQGDIIISDVGAHKMWISRYLQTEEPNTVLVSNGWCSMGFALPGAIAAKLVYPDRRVLAICGDGGFLMNVQDLETAVREKLNIVVMVWADSQYGLIKWKQQSAFGKYSHIDFTNPDFAKLADAFGMAGFIAKSAADVAPMLQKAFACGQPALVVVPIDYAENMKLTASLKQIPATAVVEALGGVDMFKGMPRQFRESIAEEMVERRFGAGTVVFREGDAGTEVFLVHSGEFSVERGGREIARLKAGQAFGEMAAISDAPRSATITATSDAVVSVLRAKDFRALLAAQPAMGLELARTFAERLAKGS